MTAKKFEFIAQAKKQHISRDRCPFIHYIGPFWYLVSKKFYHHSVIFHFERLLRCETVKIWKIHWKLMIFKTQDCFANISSTIAPIFMKLQTNIHQIVKNDHKIFCKDPCANARTRGINVRARVSSRQNKNDV